MCEFETQKMLLTVLSSLHQDLAAINMEPLQNYSFDYSFEVKEPFSRLKKIIFECFCKQFGHNIQHGREFEFSIEANKSRCLDLFKVDEDLLPKLLRQNLICKSDIARMDKIAIRGTACSNRKFTAKSMRDEMNYYQVGVMTIDKETKVTAKLLDAEEMKWFESQYEI